MKKIAVVLIAGTAVYLWCFVFDTLAHRRASHRTTVRLVAEARSSPHSTFAVDQLIYMVGGDYEFEAVMAAAAIGKLGDSVGTRVPRIAQLTNSPISSVRQQIIRSLGELGPSAKESVPTLVRLARNRVSQGNRDDALDALVKICIPLSDFTSLMVSIDGGSEVLRNVSARAEERQCNSTERNGVMQ